MKTLFISILLSLLCVSTAHSKVTYLHSNPWGSIVAATNESGVQLWVKRYTPYGTESEASGTVSDSGANHGFATHEVDKETGLVYMKARYYDPAVGRFVSEDPLGFDGGGFNYYGYVGNNPLNGIDPLGLQGYQYYRGISGTLMVFPVGGNLAASVGINFSLESWRDIQLYANATFTPGVGAGWLFAVDQVRGFGISEANSFNPGFSASPVVHYEVSGGELYNFGGAVDFAYEEAPFGYEGDTVFGYKPSSMAGAYSFRSGFGIEPSGIGALGGVGYSMNYASFTLGQFVDYSVDFVDDFFMDWGSSDNSYLGF